MSFICKKGQQLTIKNQGLEAFSSRAFLRATIQFLPTDLAVYSLVSMTTLFAGDFRNQKDLVARPAPGEQPPHENSSELQDRECHGPSVLVLGLDSGEPETWADQAEVF